VFKKSNSPRRIAAMHIPACLLVPMITPFFQLNNLQLSVEDLLN